MKIHYLILIFILALSCESSDNETEDIEDTTEITDDYNLLAVSDRGEVFRIGNNTGNIQKTGQIRKEDDNTFISTNTLIASEEKLYAIEYVYNPSPTNNLLIYDKQNGSTQIVPLTLPNTILGDERGITALTYDGSNLIGVLAENVLIDNLAQHIIRINLQDNSVTSTEITFKKDRVSSLKQIDSKLYVSTWGQGFLSIDLSSKTVTELKFNNAALQGSRMAVLNDSEIALMQAIPGTYNGVKPVKINVTNQVITDKSNAENYGLVTVFGNTILKNQLYLNLVSTDSAYLGILKSNYETNDNTLVEIKSTSVNRNLIIVDVAN